MPAPVLADVVVTANQLSAFDVLMNQNTRPPQAAEFERLIKKPPPTEFERLLQKEFRPRELPKLDKVVVKGRRLARLGSRALAPLGLALGTYDALDFLYEKYAKKYGRAARKDSGSSGGNRSGNGKSERSTTIRTPKRNVERAPKHGTRDGGTLAPVTVTAKRASPRTALLLDQQKQRAAKRELKLKQKLEKQKEQTKQRETTHRAADKYKETRRKMREKERREKRRDRKDERKLFREGKRQLKRFTKSIGKTGKGPLTAFNLDGATSPATQTKRKCAPKPKRNDECGCPDPQYTQKLAKWESENCPQSTCKRN